VLTVSPLRSVLSLHYLNCFSRAFRFRFGTAASSQAAVFFGGKTSEVTPTNYSSAATIFNSTDNSLTTIRFVLGVRETDIL
jgi:hypothetical protein